ncbi:probable imidazolonepropionase [Varroa jacobsoni]|uniref:probable imidazolonepropionase n=1 Tax=Varroa jacobsoni TaxID=62625 RepID=UPI000BF4F577|nr:probable imidazolonepropionase [Varroa jacobsoni]XP_022690983.1 probable imidazolonepropionase [Varroa jacobsoni]
MSSSSGNRLKRLLVFNCAELVQVVNDGQLYLAGTDMSTMCVLRPKHKGDSLALATDADGNILDIGSTEELTNKYKASEFETVIDAEKGALMPGFVDGHTHPIWSGDRVHEFALKLSGASYMEIHQNKGGIHYTVECTRAESDSKLKQLLTDRLRLMARSGTTAAECKTGYGLWLEDELRLLRILNEVRNQDDIIDMSLTYLGAHAVPRDFNGTSDLFAHKIATEDLLQLNQQVAFDNVDVFCEKNVFETESSRVILESAKKLGYRLNFHAEELSCINGVEMGCSLGARAMSHLECISDEGIKQMAITHAAGVILPTTAHVLRISPPPLRDMIEGGVIVALGSDFNPNAFCYAMPTVMHLACVQCKMSLTEAFVAATLNAAYSIGRSHRYGSLEIGKEANLVLIKETTWEHIIYQLGCHADLIRHVFYKGRILV